MIPRPNPDERNQIGAPLTPRQLEVLHLVALGEPTAAIAAHLGVGENTVKTHITAVYRKIGARNRVQAALHYQDYYAPRVSG